MKYPVAKKFRKILKGLIMNDSTITIGYGAGIGQTSLIKQLRNNL